MVYRQDGSGVIADIVMKFRFSRRNNGESMKGRVQSILQQMLNNSGNLEISPPSGITGKYHFYTILFQSVSQDYSFKFTS
jgi:hypothetical protein